MGHYNYTVPEGIVGEVGTTAKHTIRSFVANDTIPFGSILTTKLESDLTKKVAIIQTALRTERTLGVAVYQPTHPTSTYVQYDNMSVLTEGDIRVKVRVGSEFRAGDSVYIGYYSDTDTIEFTSDELKGDTVYGTFIDGGESTSTNSFRINFKPCNRRIPSN